MGAAIGRFLWSAATYCIPVPLALIAAIWAWWAIDKTSAVRTAVDKALSEAVAGAEIAALNALVIEERRLRAFQEGRATALAAAVSRFDDARKIADLESERLQHDLDAIRARPENSGCDVDDDLLGRLRNR